METSSNSTNNKAATASPRRSGRARTSTTIEIDGHTVLKQNNYEVKGDNYVWGKEDDSEASKPLQPPKPKKIKTIHNTNEEKPRRPQDVAKSQHNATIVKATKDKQSLRNSFLAQHVDMLKHFCESSVTDKLLQHASNNKATPVAPPQVETPQMIEATLRDYQTKGLEFMVRMHRQNLSMILGDEMGLGKTLQTISFLCHLKEQEHITGPSLVICPLSVLSSWCNELQQWAPQLKYFRLHASNKDEQERQKIQLQQALDYDVILTTYEMAKVPTLTSVYQRLHFHYLVLDEGHKIKGHTTHIARAVRQIHRGNALLLTGTPLQNNLVELWSLLNFLYPDIFTTPDPFHKHFDLQENIVDKEFLQKTQHLLELFMLRRLKSKVELDMPIKLETKVYCPLSKSQTFWYKSLLMKDAGKLANMVDGTTGGMQPVEKVCITSGKVLEHFESAKAAATSLGTYGPKLSDYIRSPHQDNNIEPFMGYHWRFRQVEEPSEQAPPELSGTRHALLRALFMQLRKCCNHPFLFEGAEGDPNTTSLEDLVSSSGKLAVLDMLLLSLFQKGNRAVLFTQFTMLLDLLEDYCLMRGWKYCRLDGSTERARRNYLIQRFNEPRSPYFLFLMSTRSGGMGLNLQSADTCILFDSDWNPQCDIQAMGRVHRIGQTKTVHVYRLVSSGTIEERMLERADKKLVLEMVNRESKEEGDDNKNSDEDKARGLSASELLEDIRFGCEAIFGNSTNNELPSWEDIDNITDRSRKESDSIGKLQGGTSKTAQSFNAQKDFSATQHFGGANFRDIRTKLEEQEKKRTPKNLQGIAHLWKEIEALGNKKRAKKSRIVLLEGKGSGYGSATVPVLASNNYDLQNGESSVFDRELRQKNKANFEVKKRKKGAQHENQGHCQVCGDGGSLVCCPRCPCSVHLKCVHLKNANQFLSCPHHRCTKCFKDRASAGGVLFPCQSCPNSFCEDCLPKKGVTFLEKVDRFEKLGFNSTKHNVYIHCHPMCESFAQAEFGYRPPRQRKLSPERLNLKYNFGASFDLEAAQAELEAEKEEVQSKNVHNLRGGRTVKREVTPDKQKSLSAGSGYKVRVQKMCPTSLKILDDYESISEAAKSVGSYGARLINHFSKSPNEAFMGFYWRKGPGSNKTGEPEIITLAAGCTSPISITDSTDGVVTSNAAVASTGATHAASGRAASPISIADSSD